MGDLPRGYHTIRINYFDAGEKNALKLLLDGRIANTGRKKLVAFGWGGLEVFDGAKFQQ
jgi:hypothetical protein